MQQCTTIQECIEQYKQEQQHITNYLQTTLDNIHHSNLLDLQDNSNYLVYAYKDISTQCRTRYVLAVKANPNNVRLKDCNPIEVGTQLQLYIADKTVRDYLYYNDDNDYWERIGPKHYGRVTGKPILQLRREGYKYDKQNHKQPIVRVSGFWESNDFLYNAVGEDNARVQEENEKLDTLQQTNTIEFKHNPLCSKCKKIDELVTTGDVIHILDTYPYKGSHLILLRCNGNEHTCKSNRWLDELLANRTITFHVVASVSKRHPITKRRCISFVV